MSVKKGFPQLPIAIQQMIEKFLTPKDLQYYYHTRIDVSNLDTLDLNVSNLDVPKLDVSDLNVSNLDVSDLNVSDYFTILTNKMACLPRIRSYCEVFGIVSLAPLLVEMDKIMVRLIASPDSLYSYKIIRNFFHTRKSLVTTAIWLASYSQISFNVVVDVPDGIAWQPTLDTITLNVNNTQYPLISLRKKWLVPNQLLQLSFELPHCGLPIEALPHTRLTLANKSYENSTKTMSKSEFLRHMTTPVDEWTSCIYVMSKKIEKKQHIDFWLQNNNQVRDRLSWLLLNLYELHNFNFALLYPFIKQTMTIISRIYKPTTITLDNKYLPIKDIQESVKTNNFSDIQITLCLDKNIYDDPMIVDTYGTPRIGLIDLVFVLPNAQTNKELKSIHKVKLAAESKIIWGNQMLLTIHIRNVGMS